MFDESRERGELNFDFEAGLKVRVLPPLQHSTTHTITCIVSIMHTYTPHSKRLCLLIHLTILSSLKFFFVF